MSNIHQPTASNDLQELFGETIYAYTRQQALLDGQLIDVTAVARETGFKLPVALTRAAWNDCVEWTAADNQRQTYQDESGRLWDVLWMAYLAARKAHGNEIRFLAYRVPRGSRSTHPRLTQLKALIGPGHSGEPVVTILLLEED